MRNILLILEYDGTNYHGFQRQAGQLTIQEVLEGAIARITKEDIVRVTAAGRTDAGVHARGQVVNFKTLARMPARDFMPALNSILPGDIRVRESREVPLEFHARFDAISKVYGYTIQRGTYLSPFLRNYAHHVPYPLDVEKMRLAGSFLIGRHDLTSFCASGSETKTSVRTIMNLELVEKGDLLTLIVEADGFLYNMVRIIAGTLIDVGRGRTPPGALPEILAGRDRRLAGPTAPARGLTLLSVKYKDSSTGRAPHRQGA